MTTQPAQPGPRLCHLVDTDRHNLEMALALGLHVVAQCGLKFIPTLGEDEAAAFPECKACHGRQRTRGQHRTPAPVRAEFPHYVYRCFDFQDRLLYVGCTYNPPARMKQHRAERKAWIGDVARTRLTVFPNRRKALDMERLAIETEHPIFNRQFKQQESA